ncbi:MAG: isochorismatase family protein [Candidatus Omnitrophota bacterium]
MKDVYFNDETINTEADDLMRAISPLRKHTDRVFNLHSPALLVLDMQRYFLDDHSHAFVPSAPAIVPNIQTLQEQFLNRHLPVIQTRHTNSPANAGQMKTWWKDLIRETDPHASLIDEIRDPRAVILPKTQYDAFFQTDLEQRLHENRITQVVITGVMTHLCCDTTARSAFIRGFEVFFMVDATATYNRQFHLASLLNLSHGFAIPTLTHDILTAFHRPNERGVTLNGS